MTDRQREILRHALGLDRGGVAYRDHYCASPSSLDYDDCEALVAGGLMERRIGAYSIYFVTTNGRQALLGGPDVASVNRGGAETRNAVIESATIARDERGYLTAWIYLEYGGASQGFGGFALYLPKSFANHSLESVAGHFVYRVLETVGVDQWSDLPGRTIRAKTDHLRVYAIGHIVKDSWFDPQDELAKVGKAP